jgi:P-type Cu+ transporter
VRIGNAEFLKSIGIALPTDLEYTKVKDYVGTLTIVWIAIDGKAEGSLALVDELKPTSKKAVEDMTRDGLKLLLLSGDTEKATHAVAERAGIEEVEGGATPEWKSEVVKKVRSEKKIVVMAGDGINDAPALAAADVGIAMGTGTDVAMESAGITLVKGDLRGIVRARKLSRATIQNIKQNLWFAFLYNAIGIPIAAGILYPWLGLLLSPMIASAAMSFSSVSVIANALRLRRARL